MWKYIGPALDHLGASDEQKKKVRAHVRETVSKFTSCERARRVHNQRLGQQAKRPGIIAKKPNEWFVAGITEIAI